MGASSAFAAVLLSDIVRSTQLRIRLGASYTRLLREHDELVGRVLERFAALTREDTGDGFLATFDSTSAALRAACALQWAVVERNAGVASDQRFSIRVVLAAGELYGRADKRSGMALVDVARLENETEADEVRCTEVFRLLASEQAPALFVGAEDLTFQGVDETRRVWKVDWRAAPPFPTELPLPGPLLGRPGEVFVGREPELAQLTRAWNLVPHSGHRLVLLRGGVGMGKSALARQFARQVHDQRGWVLYGRCDAESLTPFQPFTEALATFVRDTDGSRQLLGRFPEHLERLRHGVDGAVGPNAAAGDQEGERYELFEAVADWLALISSQDPVLLVIDDLNWADRATLELLRHVVRSGHLGSVCVVATYRSVEHDQSPAFQLGLPELEHLDREIDVITLSGLSEGQVGEAVARRLGDRATPGVGPFAHDLRSYTAGNPLFVLAILGDLGDEVLWQLRGGSAPAGALAAIGVPSDVLELFRGRYERLGPHAQSFLDVACLMGSSFDRTIATRAVGHASEEVARAVEALVGADFIRPKEGDVLEFSHAVIREAALRNLADRGPDHPGPGMGSLHVAVARAIESSQDRLVAAAELSHHLSFSDDPDDRRSAADYAVLAGDRAMGSLAPALAARHYRHALELSQTLADPLRDVDQCDLESKLGYALKHAGDPEATERLLVAARSAQRLGDPRRMARTALATISDLWSVTGSVDSAKIEVVEEAILATGEDSPGLRAGLLAGLAAELTFAGDRPRQKALMEEAMALARRTYETGRRPADAGVLARVLEHRHTVLLDPAGLAERRAVIAELDELSAGSAPNRAFTTASFGFWTAVESGDVADCRRRLRLMRDITAGVNHPRLLAITEHWSSVMASLFGQLDEAERLASEAHELFRSIGSSDALVFNVGLRYLPMWFRGQCKELIDDLEVCSEAQPGRVGMRAGLAHFWSVIGDLERCTEMLDTIDLDNSNAHQDQLPTLAMVTMAAAAAGDVSRGSAIRRIMEPFGGQFVFNGTACFGSTWHYLALASATTGDFEDADGWFHAASTAHAELPAPALLALTKLEWAKALLRRRAPSDAIRGRVLLEDALTIAHGLGLGALEAESHRLLAGETH